MKQKLPPAAMTTTTNSSQESNQVVVGENQSKSGVGSQSRNQSGEAEGAAAEDSGRERLKRHRGEVAGRVWIPEIWGQEELLKDWVDCCGFDAYWMNTNIILARTALVEDTRTHSTRLRIDNTC